MSLALGVAGAPKLPLAVGNGESLAIRVAVKRQMWLRDRRQGVHLAVTAGDGQPASY